MNSVLKRLKGCIPDSGDVLAVLVVGSMGVTVVGMWGLMLADIAIGQVKDLWRGDE